MNLQQAQELIRETLKQFDFTGIRDPQFAVNQHGVICHGWEGDSWSFEQGGGDTFAKAYAALREKIPTGKMLAERKRHTAAKLLIEAKEIEAGKS